MDSLDIAKKLAALVENYQTADQKVQITKVLRPYLGGRTEL